VAVIQEAYVNGVSTRKVDRLVTQLGLSGISRSAVSRLCSDLDQQVRLFRERPLEGAYPYLWLDAKVERVREPGGVRSKALVVAYGVHETGRREIIGIDVGEAETEVFWREFLRSLRSRGLAGVALCVSDAHEGLKCAVAKVLGCPWQRCTVHFLRDMLGHCSKAQQPMIATAIRQIFAAEAAAEARERLAGVAAALERTAPKVARLLAEAEDELLAFMAFPVEHWSKLRSTNPLERVNREIGRRSDVVGIYPNDAALVRLAGALLIEQNDEWLVGRRYLSAESLAALLARPTDAAGVVEVSALPAA
jgi:transposase-like protein